MIIKLAFCPRCRAPHVPPEIAERVRNGERIEIDIIYQSGVAGNVLRWGTGAINIDACRVGSYGGTTAVDRARKGNGNIARWEEGNTGARNKIAAINAVRWPANIVHDGSAEVLAAFPETSSGDLKPYTERHENRTSFGFDRQKTFEKAGDSGSAARFFASFPQQNEPRCGLCGLLLTPLSAIDSPCNANNAEPNSSTQSTPSGASVRCDAVASPAPESAAKRNPSSAHVSNAESSSSPCHPQNQSSVLSNAALLGERRIARNVQSAGNLCGSCATAIAQSLVVTRLGQDPASRPLPDFISEHSAQILKQYLALYVEGRENTDTILTIPSLKMFFGSVFHAIALSTEIGESSKDAPIKFGKRFHYDSKADSDDRLGSKHPTVKPVDLMQWLCRLVCPPGGTILDPFAGTGTTGEAAWREGFNAVLIEREPEYQADVARRMSLCQSSGAERRRESAKARFGEPADAGPLFRK